VREDEVPPPEERVQVREGAWYRDRDWYVCRERTTKPFGHIKIEATRALFRGLAGFFTTSLKNTPSAWMIPRIAFPFPVPVLCMGHFRQALLGHSYQAPKVLRRRLLTACDAHAGLGDVDVEFKQFAVDTGRAPERILAAHLANQLANLFRHWWTPGLAMTDFPRPEQIEAFAVPANDGFRLDDDQGRLPIVPSFAQP
jgi:hypothetical protein